MSQFSEEQLKKFSDLRLVGGSVNTSSGTTKFDYSRISELLNKGGFPAPDLSIDMTKRPTKVLCNDGTIQFQINHPNAKVMDACAKNGGRSANQPIDFVKYEQDQFNLEKAKYNAEKSMSDAQKNKTKEPIYYVLVTAGVMIAGYFAYKKFKK
jgi:hypothetical protein